MQSCGRYRRMSGTAGAARPMNRARHETPADWAACRIQSAGFSSRQFSATGRGVPGERRGPQPLTGPFPPPGGRKERRGIPSERAMPGSRRRHRSSGEKGGEPFQDGGFRHRTVSTALRGACGFAPTWAPTFVAAGQSVFRTGERRPASTAGLPAPSRGSASQSLR